MAANIYPLRTMEEEASEWIARTEEECTAEQAARLQQWLAADVRHQEVYDGMRQQWQRVSAIADVVARLDRGERPRPAAGPGGRGRLLWAALAAGIVAGLAMVFTLLRDSAVLEQPLQYSTAVGQYRSIVLSEGSTIELNTATRVEVRMSATQRLVRLAAGEALFKVQPDPGRPFIVVAGSSVVRALGTAFAIRLASDNTNVMVTEGRVLVSPLHVRETDGPTSPDFEKVLGAGEQVSITTAIGDVAALPPREVNRTLAWRRGALNIQDQPLGEVIAEVERYSATRFRIADPELTGIKVGGYFRAGDIDAFVTLLEGQFPIRAERPDPHTIVLRRR